MEIRPTNEGIVLDFFVVTNPAALLEALIVFRQSHRRLIYERLSVDNITVDWRDNAVCDISFDLRDPEFITFISSNFNVASCEIANTNLPLALRLFQHAIKEGYIEILSAPPIRDPALATLAKQLNPGREGYSIDYPEHGGQNAPISICPDWPNTAGANLQLALSSSFQMAVADPRFGQTGNDPLVQSGMFAQRATGLLRDFLSRWEPQSFSELQGAIDHPTLLPHLVEQISTLLEDRQYQQDLKLFLPRVAADALTFGAASHIEMLYRIFKKQFE